MDNFFHNINKRLNDIGGKQDLTEGAVSEIAHDTGKKLLSKGERSSLARQARAGKDIGKPGKMFKKVAADAARRYGSKEAGERVAAAAMFKNAAKHESIGSTSGTLEEGHCPTCNCSPCSCNEGNAFSGAVAKAKASGAKKGEKFRVGGKTYSLKEADPTEMEEGVFDKNPDQRRPKKARYTPNKGELNQVPGVQDLTTKTKEHPLKNVAKGLKAFVKGEPEPMDEQKKSKPDYLDLDDDGDKKEPMKKAADDKKSKSGGQSTAGTVFDPEYRAKMKKEKEGTGNFEKKKTSTGTVYTRRHKDDDDEKDDDVKSDEPKKKGRPKGPAKGPERVTAKAWKHKGGRPVKENDIPVVDRGEYDQEGDMAKDNMHTIIRHARELETHLKDSENLPTWVIEKIGQIKGMMTSVSDYMLSQHERGAEQATGQEGIEMVPERAVSVKQRRAAGIAHAAQKGDIPKSNLRGASKQMAKMPAGELKKFASTKEKGLPKKVKETTTSGSVATVANAAPKSKGGMSFGKGVYEAAVNESYERKLASVLNESEGLWQEIVSALAQGYPDLDPSDSLAAIMKKYNLSYDRLDRMAQERGYADVYDVMNDFRDVSESGNYEQSEGGKLSELLKLAGLGNTDSGCCDSCGHSTCSCGTVGEAYGDTATTNNMPDWPTDTETVDDNDPHLRRLSGGLNGPKSTGQTTTPVIASQVRRQVSMEENVKLERDLFKLYKNYNPE